MTDPTNPREEEQRRLAVPAPGLSAWQRYCPTDAWREASLQRMEDYLDEPGTRARFDEHEVTEVYPREILQRLQELGLSEMLAPRGDSERFTAFHMCALNHMAARRDTSVAVTLSVNFLGLMPAYLAASPEQIEKISACIEAGSFSSLLLSELEHGSNILRNQARATRGTLDAAGAFVPVADGEPCTHYQLNGEKHLINGGKEHGLMFVCMRTKNSGASDPQSAVTNAMEVRGDFAMFWLERGPGMIPVDRYLTLPARAADISGVRFEDCVVSADRVIGREDAGLTLIHKTLMLSRGGVSALASGCLSRARGMAMAYAQRRNVYGNPIVNLGGISDHLMRMEALDLMVSAISVKATCLINSVGVAASHYTCVAKVMACDLAEEGVAEGQRVLGARSLLRELPYERLIRDINLFGIFDGTSHVMLEELATRLAQISRPTTVDPASEPEDTVGEIRACYRAPGQPVVDVLRRFRRPLMLPLVEHLRALDALGGAQSLAPLVVAAEGLFALAQRLSATGQWKADQGTRLAAAEWFAMLEVLVAAIEVCDPKRRAELGLAEPADVDPAWDGPFLAFGVAWLGARVISGVRQLWMRTEVDESLEQQLAVLTRAEWDLSRDLDEWRRRCREALLAGGARCEA